MTDEEKKQYIRQRNAGMLPWELDQSPLHQSQRNIRYLVRRQFSLRFPEKGARVQPLPKDFMPSPEIIEFLEVHLGIPPEFIKTQLIDFKLYWNETGEARKAWQNKFKSHVIYQWKRNQSEAGQRSHRTTTEKLTDRSWDEGFELDSETE